MKDFKDFLQSSQKCFVRANLNTVFGLKLELLCISFIESIRSSFINFHGFVTAHKASNRLYKQNNPAVFKAKFI